VVCVTLIKICQCTVHSLFLCEEFCGFAWRGFKSLVLFQVIFFFIYKSFFSNFSNAFPITCFIFHFQKFFSNFSNAFPITFSIFFFKSFFQYASLIPFIKILLFFQRCQYYPNLFFLSSKWRSNKKVLNFHLLNSLFHGVGF
jgi:hypothetical protein